MTLVAESRVQVSANQSNFVSEVFHNLSQPLTALQCWLELSLVRDQTLDEFRASVEAALGNAQRLRQSLVLMRELSDADDPGDTSTPVPLHELLQELREDFLPVCESDGGHFHLHCAPIQVRANRAKLRRAFFCLMEYLLRSSCHRSLSVDVKRTKRRHAEIRTAFSGATSPARSTDEISEPISGGEVDIAQRTFRAVGGDLTLATSAGGQRVLLARLPLAG